MMAINFTVFVHTDDIGDKDSAIPADCATNQMLCTQ